MGVMEQEVVVTGTVDDITEGIARVSSKAEQNGKAIVKNAKAELAA
jgi:hypothetical protein